MRKTITILGVLILLTSCAVQVKSIGLKRRFYDDIPLNALVKNEIGDKLITKGEEEFQDALKITESPDFKIQNVVYPYKKGDVFPLSGYTDEWFLYYDIKNIKTDEASYKGNNYITTSFFGIAVSKKDKSIINPFVNFATGSLGGLVTKKVDGFKTQSDTFIGNNCSNCFKQEFIFNGKVGSSLKFIYREYINDMARPAFNQELQYDLNESNTVGFKGLRMEIVNATNTSIEYKVLSSFNKIQ